MTADNPSPFVAKLRFPEFKAGPEWREVTLGTLLDRPPEYGVNAAAVPFSESLPTYIRITDIDDDGQFKARAQVSVDIEATDEQYLEDGDIVLARTGASVGKSYRFRQEDGRLVYAGFLIRIRPNPERLLSRFLAAYLLTWSYWDWVRLTSARSGQPGINGNEYASMPLPLPPDGRGLAEQLKIADCLGSVDDLIAAEGRKLETLRQHKQGLMRQLFPLPGETVPRLRFPEFRDNGEWEERKAGNLFMNRINKGEEGLPIYSVTMHDGMVRRDSLDRNYYDIEEAAGNKKACKNDIAYNMMRMWQGALGVAPEDCLVSPAYIVLAPQKHVVSRFFEYLFKLPASLLLLTSYSRGLTKDRLRLYYHDFARIPLRCPSEPEQQRIADCLSSLDTHIAGQARRLAVLGRHKRSLLQQLFPRLEEEAR